MKMLPYRHARASALAVHLVLLGACSTTGPQPGPGTADARAPDSYAPFVAVHFAPDGRLWRLRLDDAHLYVDSSADLGNHYTPPVRVNAHPLPLRATAEDRPGIIADGKGRVVVSFAADVPRPWTTHVAISTDGGHTFAAPQTVNDGAASARNFQHLMALGPDGRVHRYWHGLRPRQEDDSITDLYHAELPGSAERIAGDLCACCRHALDFDPGGRPVLLARMVYPGQIRDHGLIEPGPASSWSTRRITHDLWQIDACPEHGPALSIGEDGRQHYAWFTQGSVRQGLYYAHSDDDGRQVSSPLPFGNAHALAGHPQVLRAGTRVVLAWQEYDGKTTTIWTQTSPDRGETWSAPSPAVSGAGRADYPFLLRRGEEIFLSWNTNQIGHRLIRIP